jgi:2-dehydropantoate 2-reductase
MRILIYGAGVIGSIFAGKLAASGHDITMLARGRRAEELREHMLSLSVPGAGRTDTVWVNVTERLAPDDLYDYIIVAMQRTQVDEILPILAENHSKNIVFVVNTAGGYDRWAQAVGSDRPMLGFPSVGGERIDGEVVYFIGKGNYNGKALHRRPGGAVVSAGRV